MLCIAHAVCVVDVCCFLIEAGVVYADAACVVDVCCCFLTAVVAETVAPALNTLRLKV